MRLRDFFAGRRDRRLRSVDSAVGFTAPIDALAALLVAHRQAGDEGWVTFEAASADRKAVLEVAGDQLNFCTVEVDLRETLTEVGMPTLAELARPGGDHETDRALWRVPDASTDELAAIIDAALTQCLGMQPGYRVRGKRQT